MDSVKILGGPMHAKVTQEQPCSIQAHSVFPLGFPTGCLDEVHPRGTPPPLSRLYACLSPSRTHRAAIMSAPVERAVAHIELEDLRQRARAALSSIRVERGLDLVKPEPRADAAAGAPSEVAAAVAAARATHVQRLRSLSGMRSGASMAANDPDGPELLTMLPEDVLLIIVAAVHPRATERLRATFELSTSCSKLRSGLQDARLLYLTEAARELISDPPTCDMLGGSRCSTAAVGLCNLSSRGLGLFECQLLARALCIGMLPSVTTLWLQHNAIDDNGVRWLAHGLRSMPAERQALRSISMGANAFHKQWGAANPPAALVRAIEMLRGAAAERGIVLRLNS